MFKTTNEFEMNYGPAMKQAWDCAIKRNDKIAIKQFNQLKGKKQEQLNQSEKSFVIRWYLRSFED